MPNQKYKKEDYVYCRDIYTRIAGENFNQALQKDLWLTERLNHTGEQFTERLFWFAGISIGILPFASGSKILADTPVSPLLVVAVSLLIISLLLGIINQFMTGNFYKNGREKNIRRIENWQPVVVKFQNKWIEPTEVISAFEHAAGVDEGLALNQELRSPDWPMIAQTITVILGFLLEIAVLFVI